METLIEGALLAIVVVFVFLRDIRATIVTALALPLSIIPTFWAMDAIGFSLNLVSLLAITLVTGILVDDAIVEIENIVRHMRMGKSAYRASLEAADEIGLAVIAISLSIAAIFSPVSFMGGIAGQYFRQFGLTVAIAVHLLAAGRALRHARHLRLLHAPAARPRASDGAVMRGYTRLVRGSVRHRWITLFVGALIFAASLWSTSLLPSGFMPADDVGRVLLAVELPPGSRLDDTDKVTRAISDKLRAMPEVRSALIFGGQLLGGGSEPRKATVVINFVHKSEREATQKDLQTRIGAMLADQPDIRFWFLKDNGQRDLSLIVAGPDIDVINDTANQIASEMRGDPDHRESDLDGGARSPGAARHAEAPGGGRPRRLDRGAVGDDPRRDARRHRRQPRQVQRRRSAGPDPRRTRRGGALAGRPVAGPCAFPPQAAARPRSRSSPISR